MVKIPYGESSFKGMIENRFFYQDRTMYIRQLEKNAARFLFFLRPRRFGKSLFVSMLHYYYGLEHKEEFTHLFGKLNIGKKSTPLANSYLILSFEFSGIMTDTPQNTHEGFINKVKSAVDLFLSAYKIYFSEAQQTEILSEKRANDVIKKLFDCHVKNKVPYPIYILVDEYDHFANELISFNFDYFKQSVTGTGFIKKFYETIKTATRDNVVHRLFVTGVSPITLDSLTSGFNIATNLSLDLNCHQMMGFDEQEVQKLLVKIGVKKTHLAEVTDDVRTWYNGYLFNEKAKNRIYNPDMVLYFAQFYQQYKEYPPNLLDNNIASDYGKIKNVFRIQNRETEHLEALRTLSETGQISSQLTTQFNFERAFDEDDLISLLFYMGFLTIATKNLSNVVFQFPNFVIKRLYADYFVTILQNKADLPINNVPLNNAVIELATKGNVQPFMEQVGNILKILSNRDAYHFNEMSLKAIFVSCLFQQQFYYVHSEYETEKGYADVFLEAIRGYDPNYQIAFELKYIKKKDKNEADKKIGDKDIQALLDKAENQLTDYMVSKKFIDRKGLKGFMVICHGDNLIWRPHKGFPIP